MGGGGEGRWESIYPGVLINTGTTFNYRKLFILFPII